MFNALKPPRLQARHVPATVLAGVLLLHAVLLVLAVRLGVWPDRASMRGDLPAVTAPVLLWLLDRKPPRPAATRAAPPFAQPPRAARLPPAELPSAAPSNPQAITLPAPAAEPPAEAPRPSERASLAPAAPAAPATLNLSLPRAASGAWRQRNPALDDARANRVSRSLEARIAVALGGDPNGPISEEQLADGSRRFRRGSQCAIARPNQAQNLDPYNSSFMPKPRLLDKC